jgi:hypothetical protein
MRIVAAEFGYTGTLSQALVDFARRQLVNATMYKGDEHRREQRHPMMVPVIAVPVDERNQPLGAPFELITRDVSTTSIGLLSETEIVHRRLAIHLSLADTEIDLVIAVLWSDAMGLFYGAGGRYIERIERFPCELPCLAHQNS